MTREALIVTVIWVVIAYTLALGGDSRAGLFRALTFFGGAITLIYNFMGQIKSLLLEVRTDWVSLVGLVGYLMFAIGLTGVALKWDQRDRR